MSAHYFYFFYQRFFTSTLGWKDDAVGAYIRLLSYQFDNNGLPDDFNFLCSLTTSLKKNKDLIMPKFKKCEDGKLRNEVMQREFERSKNMSENNSIRAKKRWKNNATALPANMPQQCRRNAIPINQYTNKPITDNFKEPVVVGEPAQNSQQQQQEFCENDALIFQMFKNCSDWKTDVILREMGRFKNKYPTLPLNETGPVINSWVANYRTPEKLEYKRFKL